jgi:thiol-disulfide isomerase/thioredoxin
MNPFKSITLWCCVVISLVSSSTIAQEQSANEILEASAAALSTTTGISAQFKMEGVGGGPFASTMPSMNGQFFWGTHPELGRVIHIVGESRDQQSAPPRSVDIAITADKYLWTDHTKKTITEAKNAPTARGTPSAFGLVLLHSMVHEDPYAIDADSAQSIELLEQETINSQLCHVVHIKRSATAGRNRGGAGSHTDARWYISVDDKLPRKVDHITDAGVVKITLTFELNNLREIKPTDTDLDITRPSDYTFKSLIPKPRPVPTETPSDTKPVEQETTTQTQPDPQNPASQSPPQTSRPTQAPAYEFTSESGTQITNETQQGRVTVLYFWGSWCLPCNESSPLVSQLADELADKEIDVYGLAIREADTDETRSYFEESGYKHTLVLGADLATSKFRVHIYPTIVVINKQNELVFQSSIQKGTDAKTLVNDARTAIDQLFE